MTLIMYVSCDSFLTCPCDDHVLCAMYQVSTVYVHMFPMIQLFVVRWYHPAPFTATNTCTNIDLTDFAWAMGAYFFWQAAYLFITEGLRAHRFQSDPGLQSSLRFITTNERNTLHVTVRKLCRKWGFMQRNELMDPSTIKTKAIFVITQFFYTLVTLIFPPLLFRSYQGHIVFAVLMTITCVHSGAEYYIKVFSKRYNSGVERAYLDTLQKLQDLGDPDSFFEAQTDGEVKHEDRHKEKAL